MEYFTEHQVDERHNGQNLRPLLVARRRRLRRGVIDQSMTKGRIASQTHGNRFAGATGRPAYQWQQSAS